MLVLSRKIGEKIKIGDNITISIEGIRGDKIRLGFEAPEDVIILRGELLQRIKEAVAGEHPATADDYRRAG